MWNFKGYLWNSTQNILPIHWKMWILLTCENLRALRVKSSYAFLKRPPGIIGTLVFSYQSWYYRYTKAAAVRTLCWWTTLLFVEQKSVCWLSLLLVRMAGILHHTPFHKPRHIRSRYKGCWDTNVPFKMAGRSTAAKPHEWVISVLRSFDAVTGHRKSFLLGH